MICLGRDIDRVEDVFRYFAGPSLNCVYVPEDAQILSYMICWFILGLLGETGLTDRQIDR